MVVPKTCASDDNSFMGVAKYAWSGYVLECRDCGVIYQSRKHWYGNRDPTETEVCLFCHVYSISSLCDAFLHTITTSGIITVHVSSILELRSQCLSQSRGT